MLHKCSMTDKEIKKGLNYLPTAIKLVFSKLLDMINCLLTRNKPYFCAIEHCKNIILLECNFYLIV